MSSDACQVTTSFALRKTATKEPPLEEKKSGLSETTQTMMLNVEPSNARVITNCAHPRVRNPQFARQMKQLLNSATRELPVCAPSRRIRDARCV